MTRCSGLSGALASLLMMGACQGEAHAESEIPASLVPAGSEVRQVLYALGDQIYQCAPAATEGAKRHWQLAGPEAELFLDAAHTRHFGHHFAGPRWEAEDGSLLKGKLRTSVPAPDATSIPWLLLDVESIGKPGDLSEVTTIQRVFTEGGKAPEQACTDEAAPLKVHYTAQYRLLGPAR